jgi:hypothetical protein
MARRLLRASIATAVMAAVATWHLPASSAQDPRIRVQPADIVHLNQTLAAYLAGDDLAVERDLATPEGMNSLLALERVFNVTPGWNRTQAAFLLEIAGAVPVTSRYRYAAIRLAVATSLVRTDHPIANPVDDRFEVLWHQTALGVLQETGLFDLQQQHLIAIAPRYDYARRRALETRYALAHAIAAAGLCCPVRSEATIIVINRSQPRPAKPSFDDAMGRMIAAAAEPSLRTEALIRGALLQLQTGRPQEAIVWLDRVPADVSDGVLRYAAQLTRARAFDALHRPDDSIIAYAAARREGPAAQTPAIGLAAALLRVGRTDEAVRIAAEARRLGADAVDPRDVFRRADARFVPGWLAEIRQLRK